MRSRFGLTAMTLMIFVLTMLAGCSKSKTNDTPPDGTTAKLRFVFMADSRGDSLDHPVNLPVLQAIISQVGKLSPKPAFVIFGGDMSYRGYIGHSYTFQEWKDLFKPLADSGIVLYTCIGNHELYHEHSSYGYFVQNQQQYQQVFSENPSNGPAGYERLAYSFTDTVTSSFFVVLDPYYVTTDSVHMGLGGTIEPVEMTWLKSQVAQTAALHKFLFIHTPYYYISNDPEEPSSADSTLTALWSFIDANNFDFFACGHSHLFSRRTIDGSIPPNPQTTPQTPAWKNSVVQLLNGTCGAGPSTDTIKPEIKSAWNVHNDPKTYYFSVVDISGGMVTVNSYSGYTGSYSVFDTFTVTR